MYTAWSRSMRYRGPPPTLPAFVSFLRIAILVIAVIVLCLAAYAQYIINNSLGIYVYYGGGAAGLLIFVTIKTFIIHGGIFAIERLYPHFLYRAGVLVLYVISAIFWLSAWSFAASSARTWLNLYSTFDQDDGELVDDVLDAWRREGDVLAVCAALGAVAWILTVVVMFYYNQACVADPEVVAAAASAAGQHHAELGQVPQAAPAAFYPQQVPQAHVQAQQQYPMQQQQYPEQQYQYQEQQAYHQETYPKQDYQQQTAPVS